MTNIDHVDPLQFRERLHNTLVRFITSTASISSHRAPELAERVRERIEGEKLVKGPYVESLSDFEKGLSLQELVAKEQFCSEWKKIEKHAPELWKRKLHMHQYEAIQRKENYIVATGTGSGKTEAFLFPLINEFLSSRAYEKPGVKAILIYPLNALATDQMHRIARLLFRELGDPGIRLGRYTGQVRSNATREDEENLIRDTPLFQDAFGEDERVPKNWLLTRQEMLEMPPDILITNYAMLEHILLLPRNRPLLAQADLRWLVLDELHTYSGAQAIEVAFLLRKVKAYLGLEADKLRCIGTSASLDPDRKSELVTFARDLFGEDFPEDGRAIITAERKLHRTLEEKSSGIKRSADKWISLGDVLSNLRKEDFLSPDREGECVEEWNAQCPDMVLQGSHFGEALMDVLAQSSEVRKVASILHDGIASFEKLAGEIFPGEGKEKASRAVSALISLGVLAKPKNHSVFPLLPARYHMMTSAVPGIIISLDPHDEELWKEVDVAPQGREGNEQQTAAWMLWVCRNCGEPYIEAFDDGKKLHPINSPRHRSLDKKQRVILRLLGRGKSGFEEEVEETTSYKVTTFSHNDGTILEENNSEGITLQMAEMEETEYSRRPLMKKCLCCGDTGGARPEPITTVHPGDDMVASCVTSILLESLPLPGSRYVDAPLKGRNLLLFSDNRQDAAFFSPYFEKTSRIEALRGAMLASLKSAEEPLRVSDLRDEVWKNLKKKGFSLYERGMPKEPLRTSSAKDRLLGLIVSESTMVGQRKSMENFGLMSIDYEGEANLVRAILDEGGNDKLKEITPSVVKFILAMMRQSRAIDDFDQVLDLTDDSVWGEGLASEDIGWKLTYSGKGRTRALLPTDNSRDTRATWVLEQGVGIEKNEARNFLEMIWDKMNKRRLGILMTGRGGEVVNLGSWRFHYHQDNIYVCDSCAKASTFNVGGVCTAWKCKGVTRAVKRAKFFENEHNYFAVRYNEKPPSAIAREHTAALSHEDRNQVETAFREGRVNLLSCTTTMEMGIDLGDLDAILCGNVPPSISNYQQRSGRAGRRAQVAPISLVIARQSRYDQSTFANYEDYLQSPPAMPYLSLENISFLERHQVSCLISGWLELRIGAVDWSGAPRLYHVLGEKLDRDSINEIKQELEGWLYSEKSVPYMKTAEKMIEGIGIGFRGNDLRDKAKAEISRWIEAVSDRWQVTEESIKDLEAQGIRDCAGKISGYEKQQKRYLAQFVVTLFSQQAVIPTYSFPIHSLNLEMITQRGNDRAESHLNRDASIAITEYAPGSEVVTAGRIWTSAGIAKRKLHTGDQESWTEKGWYRICKSCKHPQLENDEDVFKDVCPHCENSPGESLRRYLQPSGFLTSYEKRKGRDPGSSRIRSPLTEEARLLTKPKLKDFESTNLSNVKTFFAPAYRRDGGEDDLVGHMIIVNRGPKGGGYLSCSRCEYAFPAEKNFQREMKKKHKNPRTGDPCASEKITNPQDLVHLYYTDIRGFRLCYELPSFDKEKDKSMSELSLLRTVAEAIRLAAVRVLEIDPRDLRASTELPNRNEPLIVLSDTTSGGAGYARRLASEARFSADVLFKEALEILDCSRGDQCSTSCNKCLNDYSNQQFWEDFDRHTASSWLQHVLGG
jgi:ATP-dependent helicase YprA (DUF1998 family)/uncharacterized C2H2 Zn-finger protein